MTNNKAINLIPRNIDKIRITIAGMGRMGSFHLQALQQLAEGAFEEYYKGAVQEQLSKITVCGICDTSLEKLKDSSNIRGFTDFQKMLDETKPHIVIIAAPTQAHYNLAVTSLQKGIHTFVEKPIVTSREQVDMLVRTASKNGCRLMSGHVERYNPVSIKIKSLLRENKIKPESYSFIRMQRHDDRITDDIIVDKVIHDLDLALYLFGDIEKVELKDPKKIDGKVFQATVNIKHTDDVNGSIFVSWLVESSDKIRHVSITGREHRLLGDFYIKKLLLDGREIECDVPGWIKPDSNQVKDELVDFILHCSKEYPDAKTVEPLLSLQDIVQTTILIESLILSKF